MATPTLANSHNLQPLFAEIARPFAPPGYANSQPAFRVFPTGTAEYHWRIVALGASRTISRHKSLSFALRKCARLNKQRPKGASHEIN